jgi:hypothetical protein
MADEILVDSFVEFYSKSAIKEIWRQAFVAAQERKTHVVITGQNFGEGTANGEIGGEPEELMRAAKVAHERKVATEAGDTLEMRGTGHVNFSKRIVES